jgi:hypothetical protein
MANGGQIPANLMPLLQQAGQGMYGSAMNGQTQTPMAGGSPLTPPSPAAYGGPSGNTAPTAGGNPLSANSGPPANAYNAFINALQQVQAANPIQAIGQNTPPPHKSQASQQATMHETGVG